MGEFKGCFLQFPSAIGKCLFQEEGRKGGKEGETEHQAISVLNVEVCLKFSHFLRS